MKPELKYSEDKLVKLLVPGLELLCETSNLEERKSILISNINNLVPKNPNESKIDVPEIPAKPEVIRKNRGKFFNFLLNLNDSTYVIGIVVSVIFLLSFFIVCLQERDYLYPAYSIIFTLSCVSFFFFVSLFVAKKVVSHLSSNDKKQEDKNNKKIDEYNDKIKERNKAIRHNEKVDLLRKEYLEKLRYFNDHVDDWKIELKEVENKIKLNVFKDDPNQAGHLLGGETLVAPFSYSYGPSKTITSRASDAALKTFRASDLNKFKSFFESQIPQVMKNFQIMLNQHGFSFSDFGFTDKAYKTSPSVVTPTTNLSHIPFAFLNKFF